MLRTPIRRIVAMTESARENFFNDPAADMLRSSITRKRSSGQPSSQQAVRVGGVRAFLLLRRQLQIALAVLNLAFAAAMAGRVLTGLKYTIIIPLSVCLEKVERSGSV